MAVPGVWDIRGGLTVPMGVGVGKESGEQRALWQQESLGSGSTVHPAGMKYMLLHLWRVRANTLSAHVGACKHTVIT